MKRVVKNTTIGIPALLRNQLNLAAERGDPKSELRAIAKRIRVAGESGRGVKLSANETRLLLSYNLPSTTDDPSVGD